VFRIFEIHIDDGQLDVVTLSSSDSPFATRVVWVELRVTGAGEVSAFIIEYIFTFYKKRQ